MLVPTLFWSLLCAGPFWLRSHSGQFSLLMVPVEQVAQCHRHRMRLGYKHTTRQCNLLSVYRLVRCSCRAAWRTKMRDLSNPPVRRCFAQLSFDTIQPTCPCVMALSDGWFLKWNKAQKKSGTSVDHSAFQGHFQVPQPPGGPFKSPGLCIGVRLKNAPAGQFQLHGPCRPLRK